MEESTPFCFFGTLLLLNPVGERCDGAEVCIRSVVVTVFTLRDFRNLDQGYRDIIFRTFATN